MMTIYKYPIPIEDEFEIKLPIDAEILSVQTQFGNPFIWVKVDPDNRVKSRKFRIFGTGHKHKEEVFVGRFIGTFQMDYGNLVWHLFEIED